MEVKGIMPLEMFKQIVGLKTLDFYKGKGRSICNTRIGTIYKASGCDTSKPLFITVAGENVVSKTNESLAGTLWMCNSILQLDESV